MKHVVLVISGEDADALVGTLNNALAFGLDANVRRIGDGVVAPVVHLGGTSKDALVNGVGQAMLALTTAAMRHSEAAPHGRDYKGNTMWAAIEAHNARDAALQAIVNELTDIYNAIDENAEDAVFCDECDALVDASNPSEVSLDHNDNCSLHPDNIERKSK